MAEELGVNEDGQLDLFGSADDPVEAWESDEQAAWDDCGDGDEAWLRSLPADIRAEVEARPPLPPPSPGAGLWQVYGGAAAFGDGGFFDTMLPGSALGEMLATATRDGFAGLSDEVLSGMLRAWQRQVAHCQSRLGHVLDEIARRRIEQSRRPGWSQVAEHVVDELGVELTMTSRSAERLRDVVTGLRRLPEVDSLLLSGLIDWPRACVFVDELSVLDGGAAMAITERLADRAPEWTTGQLRAALVRAVLAVDPEAAERRKKQARTETRVELWHEPSGNAALSGRELRPSSAIALDRKLSSDADWLSLCGVPGTRTELRALAYTTLLSGRELAEILNDPTCWPEDPDAVAGPDGASGQRSALAARREPAPSAGSIHLTMPIATWLGAGKPGEVPGYGPVDAQTSRELADVLARDPATRWCLTVTGADGRALGHACARHGPMAGEPVIMWAVGLRERLQILATGTCGHSRRSAGYVPSQSLRHIVQIRQRRCSFPGCRRPARQCDLDHSVPFENGGMTCECNLAPLCRRHHRAKQAPGWHLCQDQPGVMTWRLPSGRSCATTGDAYHV